MIRVQIVDRSEIDYRGFRWEMHTDASGFVAFGQDCLTREDAHRNFAEMVEGLARADWVVEDR